jgi:hypothetical protein
LTDDHEGKMEIEGWIDEVQRGRVYGRIMVEGEEMAFDMRLLDVPECQRVDLEPGSYISFVNGFLLVHKTQWLTHELEQADAQARRWAAYFRS